MNEQPSLGEIYEHYKGERYIVMGSALCAITLQKMVIYQTISTAQPSWWVISEQDFCSQAYWNGDLVPRFKHAPTKIL